MAEDAKLLAESGAPVARGTIDPELIRLTRTRPKIGIITSAGLVFLCAYFLVRLNPDRRFAATATQPTRVAASDVLAGSIGLDQLVAIDGQPLMSQAIRTTVSTRSLGLRVVPLRGTGERLWLVVSGDGFDPPAQGGYVGRLRRLGDLPFAASIAAFATDHPRPVFATAAAVRAGFATGKVATVAGDPVSLDDGNRVAFDVVDPSAAVIVCAFNERLPTTTAWTTALTAAGITTSAPQATADQARFEVGGPDVVPTLTTKLAAAGLWGARVDPVTRHFETTWGAVRGSGPTAFTFPVDDPRLASDAVGRPPTHDHASIPDDQLDLVGLYVARSIPSDAYAVLAGEHPEDYWYVLPVMFVLAAIGLMFAWALVRTVKRDLLPSRA